MKIISVLAIGLLCCGTAAAKDVLDAANDALNKAQQAIDGARSTVTNAQNLVDDTESVVDEAKQTASSARNIGKTTDAAQSPSRRAATQPGLQPAPPRSQSNSSHQEQQYEGQDRSGVAQSKASADAPTAGTFASACDNYNLTNSVQVNCNACAKQFSSMLPTLNQMAATNKNAQLETLLRSCPRAAR